MKEIDPQTVSAHKADDRNLNFVKFGWQPFVRYKPTEACTAQKSKEVWQQRKVVRRVKGARWKAHNEA